MPMEITGVRAMFLTCLVSACFGFVHFVPLFASTLVSLLNLCLVHNSFILPWLHFYSFYALCFILFHVYY